MTEKTAVLTVRVPKEVKEGLKGIDTRKLITSLYDLWRIGAISIVDSEVILPDVEEIQSERFEDIP